MSPTLYDEAGRETARSPLWRRGSRLIPPVVVYADEPPICDGAKRTSRKARIPASTKPARILGRCACTLQSLHVRYWAATTVTELSLSAVSCGDVVAQVTVSPATFVVQL